MGMFVQGSGGRAGLRGKIRHQVFWGRREDVRVNHIPGEKQKTKA